MYKSKEPKSYQYLAAILASSLILSVILIIVVLLLEFAFYPELLAGLILYLCPESKSIDKKALRIAKLTKQNQQSTARELLKPLLAREVNRLSSSWYYQSINESLILRNRSILFRSHIYILAFGPIAALAYRLLTLIQQAWRSDIPQIVTF
ncbi:hypothetical protein P4S63_07475 [Pseudoalteromonas sp. B193]